jgi:hypothetical protein
VAKPDRATSSFADDAPGSRAFYSRPGNDLTHRFPLIVEALARLRSRTCIIDGEAVACGDDGVPSFDRIRYRRHDASVLLYEIDHPLLGPIPKIAFRPSTFEMVVKMVDARKMQLCRLQ